MKTTRCNKVVAAKVTPVKSTKKKTKSSAAAAATTDTSAKLSIKIVPIQARGYNTKAKISKAHLTTMKKLNAYEFDWIDAGDTNVEIMKYSNADKIDRTQEIKVSFLANQFKPCDIRVACAALIGKVGISAQAAFFLLPAHKLKVVESYLQLVFDERTMMADNQKKTFR